MLRKCLAALALLAVSACTSIGTQADMIPMAERPIAAPVPDGAYCPLEGAKAPLQVSGDSCARFKWNAKARVYQVSGKDDEGQTASFNVAVMPLAGGLMLLQMDTASYVTSDPTDADDFKKGPRYLQSVARLTRDTLVAIDWTLKSASSGAGQDDDRAKAFRASYPNLKFEVDGSSEVVSGEPAQVRQYLWARALEVVRTSPSDVFAQPMVRDKPGAKPHRASAKQQAAVDQAVAFFKDVARK